MLVHFSGSSRSIGKDIFLYRKIITAIRSSGHAISHDWIETAWLMKQGKGRDAKGWDLHTILLEVEAGIEAAEVAIVEATGASTLGVGYELALSLQRKKPTLILIDERYSKDSYAIALKHDLLIIKTYNSFNLTKIITTFLEDNTINNKELRFNFVIDRRIYNHLRVKSFRSGKTKAEILRDLLLDDIEKSHH